jgi:DNA-binding SARP family transcriptional activator/tetratricopeptide (TPR) repeat protein
MALGSAARFDGPMRTLALRLLGEFDVDGVEPSGLGSRKGRTLLWLLALARGGFVPVDVLVESLWPEGAPARPTDQLSVLASRLRAVVGRDRIERADSGYRLNYDWLDVDELAAVLREAESRREAGDPGAAAAPARIGLSLLASGQVRALVADGAVAWVAAQLAALDRLVVHARHVAAAALLADGAWLEAVDVAAVALELDPYDEVMMRTLMRANANGGRAATALAAYAALRERLVDELGADPSAETVALNAAILRGEISVNRPRRQAAGLPDLVGRTVELDRLDEACEAASSEAVTVVTVVGEAGIGKTTLLRHWAALREAAGDAVLFATCGDLARAAPLDPLLVALAARLRGGSGERLAELLRPDADVLAPLLGFAPTAAAASLLVAGGVVGPTLLYSALAGLVERIAGGRLVVLVVDDAHHGGPALAAWMQFMRRRQARLLVVAAVRSGEGAPMPDAQVIDLGPLGRLEAAALVGPFLAGPPRADDPRVDELFERSGGHPLFLSELALSDGADELPRSLVEAVSNRCDELGRASATLRSAAVIGVRIDLDLLAVVLNRPAVELLEDVELGVSRRLLVDEGGTFRFRHTLVRTALAATATSGRSAWLHRQVGRALARRGSVDPVEVAYHARLGGDLELAAQSLRAAAVRAGERFDHATAEALLDDALELHADEASWLERARVRTRRGDYAAAYLDVERARGLGAVASEVGAWASYFDRRFDQARRFAADGRLTADDPAVRARCLVVAGRTKHAAGDLAEAEGLLSSAADIAVGADRVMAAAWLGVLRAHQSRVEDAVELLRPATRSSLGAEHTSGVLHALLFTGHAHAIAGRPASALESFAAYAAEAERRQASRHAGRASNFSGWVLRNVGALDEGLDHHQAALEAADRAGATETRIAAREDLAEAAMHRGDLDSAAALLSAAGADIHGDLVFGWRLQLRCDLLRGRLALACDDADRALDIAVALDAQASRLGIPRYFAAARLLAHRARGRLGGPVDLAAIESDLDVLDRAVAIESWWLTGEVATTFGVARWLDRAAARAADLAAAAGPYGDLLRAEAGRRLEVWKSELG